MSETVDVLRGGVSGTFGTSGLAGGLGTGSDVGVVVAVDVAVGLGDRGALVAPAAFRPPTLGDAGALAAAFGTAAAGFDVLEAAGFFATGFGAGLSMSFPFSAPSGFCVADGVVAVSFAGAFFAGGTEGLLDTLGSGGLVDAALATILAAGFAGFAAAAAFLAPGAAGLLMLSGVVAFSTFSLDGSARGSSLCLTSSCAGSATSAMASQQSIRGGVVAAIATSFVGSLECRLIQLPLK